ncbi:hypothetical protein SSAG_05095 [Streptomyces sp. Mg1]|nr:hypothetical protein SSAG_05095 [Streptomyces sp. Mg1]
MGSLSLASAGSGALPSKHIYRRVDKRMKNYIPVRGVKVPGQTGGKRLSVAKIFAGKGLERS